MSMEKCKKEGKRRKEKKEEREVEKREDGRFTLYIYICI